MSERRPQRNILCHQKLWLYGKPHRSVRQGRSQTSAVCGQPDQPLSGKHHDALVWQDPVDNIVSEYKVRGDGRSHLGEIIDVQLDFHLTSSLEHAKDPRTSAQKLEESETGCTRTQTHSRSRKRNNSEVLRKTVYKAVPLPL